MLHDGSVMVASPPSAALPDGSAEVVVAVEELEDEVVLAAWRASRSEPSVSRVESTERSNGALTDSIASNCANAVVDSASTAKRAVVESVKNRMVEDICGGRR